MRNLVLIFTLLTTCLFAQTGINYQGAATDADGAKLVSQNISLKTSVLQGGVDGTTSYSEIHNTTTDQFGLFNVIIGQGVSISGDFESISWGSGDHFLKVELDATGGTNYNLVSTTQMMSVPYALYAKNAGLDSAAVADMLASMNISNNNGGCNFNFPEGINGQFITYDLINNYEVPENKNLYITHIYLNNSEIRVDNIRLLYGSFNSDDSGDNYNYNANHNIMVGEGQIISSYANNLHSASFSGVLVEKSSVEPVSHSLAGNANGISSSSYVVPQNKKFVLSHIFRYNNIGNIFVDDIAIQEGRTNMNWDSGRSSNFTVLVDGGQTISFDAAMETSINGYLVDEDYFADCGSGNISSTPSSIDSAMVADMIAANTSSGSGGDWELLYDELNTNNDEPYGTVNRYGIAQSDGFLYLVGSYATVYTGNDHDTITNTWPENPILQNISANDPNEAHIIPLKKNMSWHIEFHSTLGYITKGYFIPNGGGSASLANGGISGTSKSFKYPEGINNDFITLSIKNSNTYIVPENKNLYITNAYSSWGSPQLLIDNKIISKGDINYNGTRFGNPIIVGSGSIIDLSSESGTEYDILEITIQGFLTNSSVTPITFSLDEESYTVPSNKTLFIASYFSSSGSPSLKINEKTISKGDFNYNSSRGFINPIVATENEIVSTDSDYDFTINGYLVDEDYFESPSTSSASNSGGSGNSMDLSVSQYGDTLYGLGNDFLIIPGLSIANQHMQFNQYGSVTDIDGNTYKTLMYGDDEWMIENLRTNIGYYITNTDAGSMFPNNLTFTDSIGYYYTYETSQSDICPSGWHIPTLQEWQDFHFEVYGETLELTSENGALFTSENYNSLWSTHLNDGGTNQSYFNLYSTSSIWNGNGNHNLININYASFWMQDFYYINGNSSVCEINFGGLNASNPWSISFYCQNYSNGDHKQIRCVKD